MIYTPEQNPQSIRSSVLEKIKTEGTPMHSRWYFILRLTSLIVVAAGVLILSVALCNFMFFSLRINGPFSLLLFGFPGWMLFLETFPWVLLLSDIALIVVLEVLLRRFSFGYKSPILFTLLGIVLIVSAAGFFIDNGTHVNDDLLRSADQHHLPPPLRQFMESERRPQHPPPHPRPPR